MRDAEYANVVGDDNVRGYVAGPSSTNPDEIAIALDDGREISVPASALRRQPDGTWRLVKESMSESHREEVVPVIAEDLDVKKKKRVTGRVVVGKRTTERQETVAMPLTRESAHIRRVVVDRPVDAIPPVRREGDTIIVPVVEEVAVVEKRLMLKEELHISRRRTTEQHEETVTLQDEQSTVQRFDANGLPQSEPSESVVERAPEGERSILDPNIVRPSILGPKRHTRVRRNRILGES